MATFQEFYTDATNGANINSGHSTAAPITATNGSWDITSQRFIAASAAFLTGVAVGDWASIYNDGATIAVHVARITAVDVLGFYIEVSATSKSGTKPTASATGRSITVHGQWLGPNGTSAFPFGFISITATDVSGNPPCVNMKNNTTYSVTATNSANGSNGVRFQGYTSTVRDGGQAIIDGGSSGASYSILTATGDIYFRDIIFQNNGNSGSAALVSGGSRATFDRCVFKNAMGFGWTCNSAGATIKDCEAYNCGQAGAGFAGFTNAGQGSVRFVRCIAHDQATGADGFRITLNAILEKCIADSNPGVGISCVYSTVSDAWIDSCDIYNNGGDGIRIDGTSTTLPANLTIENCNLVKNGGYGINGVGTAVKTGSINNCGYGGGGSVNASGNTNGLSNVIETGPVSYSTHPWVDPANGDFRITDSAAKGTGYGGFTQTASSYAGIIAYPDIGSVQHQCTGGGGGGLLVNRGMNGGIDG